MALIAVAVFAVGLYGVGVLGIHAPQDEFDAIETQRVNQRNTLIAPTLEPLIPVGQFAVSQFEPDGLGRPDPPARVPDRHRHGDRARHVHPISDSARYRHAGRIGERRVTRIKCRVPSDE
ncbi:MAG: hypothetical protein HND48_25345 [Chloroflexi bacterium]|nr:hypothetical protein [Chloroflexota bacterium]